MMGRRETEPLSGSVAATLARVLRQRVELGQPALMLESIPRESLARALRALQQGGEFPPSGAPGEAGLATRASMAAPPTQAHPSTGDARTESRASSPAPSHPSRLPSTLDELAEQCRSCQRCGLAESRTHAVVSDGAAEARVMVVGEAPGANEDATGTPFVGAAGKLLDLLLLTVGLSRGQNVYIANVIKCRPPGNRNPTREEIEACSPYLLRQIELVRPEVILAVGTFSGQLLSGLDETLGKLRGRTHRYAGIPLVVTYHPAALLRNPGWVRPTWDDLQHLRRILDEPSEPT